MLSLPARTSLVNRRVLVASLLSLPLLSACGAELPPPGPRRALVKHGRIDPAELFPADLDLVVRFDLGRIRADLGPMADTLFARLQAEGHHEDTLVATALSRANIVWLGLRLVDLDAGDRLLVIEGDVSDLRPVPRLFAPVDPPIADGVLSFERKESLKRDATARIHLFAGNTIAFVTPAEVDSVERVLSRGPDQHRRDPAAEGLISADLRAHRLPHSLEVRFPSIASIIGGVETARANVTMIAAALRIEIEINAASDLKARKVENLLRALREGGLGSRYASLFDEMHIERIEHLLHVNITFPPAVLRSLVENKTGVEDDR